MRPEEADTLANWVMGLELERGAVCLNVGSSTRDFRERLQPHIHERFIKPLEQSGIRFIHCDMKAAEGVDEVGDILDPAFRSKLKKYKAKVLVCSNLLEHLVDPREFARACGELVVEGGHGLFTVPSSYPYHPDPIDTLLRPKPQEIVAMLPGWTEVEMAEIESGNFWDDLKKAGNPWIGLARHTARVALPMYRRRQWPAAASRLRWLVRPYVQSMVLLKKPPVAPE